MLYTLAVILVAAWLISFSIFPVSGGLIHLLLVFAAIVILLRFLQGRRALT